MWLLWLIQAYMAIILQNQKGVEGERTKMNRNPGSDDLYLLHKLNAECCYLSFLFKALLNLWMNNINTTAPQRKHSDFNKRQEAVTHIIPALRGA